MHKNLSVNEAIAELMEDQYTNWSWNGAKAMVEYLENLEDDLDKSIEFDRVAIRCDFSEYKSALEAAEQYAFIPPDEEDEIEAAALKYLEDRTTVIQFDGGVIIQLTD